MNYGRISITRRPLVIVNSWHSDTFVIFLILHRIIILILFLSNSYRDNWEYEIENSLIAVVITNDLNLLPIIYEIYFMIAIRANNIKITPWCRIRNMNRKKIQFYKCYWY